MSDMQSKPFMQYEHELGGVARWHGGEYIELGYIEDGEFVALDVINVWDYASGAPLIEQTLAAFGARVEAHIAEYAEEQS